MPHSVWTFGIFVKIHDCITLTLRFDPDFDLENWVNFELWTEELEMYNF